MSGALWLLGTDVSESPSPAMHNAGLRALAMAPAYEARSCPEPDLATWLDDAERTCRGINVTMPYKARVAERYTDVLDDVARRVGAVNTVVYDGGAACLATNTDVAGLRAAWRRAACAPEGRNVLLLGAGGAARASVVALAGVEVATLAVHARRPDAAAALCAHAAREGVRIAVPGERVPHMLLIASPSVDDPDTLLDTLLPRPGFVHDLRYGPRTRALRDAALRRGHLYADGTSMLLWQGVAALGHFLGRAPGAAAEHAMAQALSAHLRRRL